MDEKEREFQWWRTGLYCDRNTTEGKERVKSAMAPVLIQISGDGEKLKALELALFDVYVSFGDNKTAMRALAELIEEQLLVVFENGKTADPS